MNVINLKKKAGYIMSTIYGKVADLENNKEFTSEEYERAINSIHLYCEKHCIAEHCSDYCCLYQFRNQTKSQ